jgi:hypothetical protein
LNRTVSGCSTKCHPRWQTVRRSRCQHTLFHVNVAATSGTRLALRWTAECRFRCHGRYPVRDPTGHSVAENTIVPWSPSQPRQACLLRIGRR